MSKQSSVTTVNNNVYWKGTMTVVPRPDNDTPRHLIREFLKSKVPQEEDNLEQYCLVSVDDPVSILDPSKSLKANGVKDGSNLVLTKRSLHVETRGDRVAAGILAVYTALLFSVATWLLVSVWPRTTGDLSLNTTTVTLVNTNVTFSLGNQTLILLAMMLAGALGACIYSVFAISLHLGHYKDFDMAWSAWYALRPFIGAGLAIIINFLVRGGLLTVGSSTKDLNLLGLTATAGIVGIYAEPSIRKLHQIADTIFGKGAETGTNQAPPATTP